MKTIKVNANLSIGYSNANREEILEFSFEDNYTEQEIKEEIEAEVRDWANNFVEIGWSIQK